MGLLTGQDKDIRLKQFEMSKVEAEYTVAKKKKDRQMNDLKGKVKLLSATMNQMGESFASLISDLDVWAQGHVNMLAT